MHTKLFGYFLLNARENVVFIQILYEIKSDLARQMPLFLLLTLQNIILEYIFLLRFFLEIIAPTPVHNSTPIPRTLSPIKVKH